MSLSLGVILVLAFGPLPILLNYYNYSFFSITFSASPNILWILYSHVIYYLILDV